ncbi:MAG: T9SS type A sorting domain-containing protein [Luteibaculaceae bacterium]
MSIETSLPINRSPRLHYVKALFLVLVFFLPVRLNAQQVIRIQTSAAQGNTFANLWLNQQPTPGSLMVIIASTRSGEDNNPNTSLLNGESVPVGGTTFSGWIKAAENHFKTFGQVNDRRGFAVYYKIAAENEPLSITASWSMGGANNVIYQEFYNLQGGFTFLGAQTSNSGANTVNSLTAGFVIPTLENNVFFVSGLVARDNIPNLSWNGDLGSDFNRFQNTIFTSSAFGQLQDNTTQSAIATWGGAARLASAFILSFELGVNTFSSPPGPTAEISRVQIAENVSNDNATATFNNSPKEGNLLIAITGTRVGDNAGERAVLNGQILSVNQPSFSGWVKVAEDHFRTTNDNRRGLAVFYKIARANEPQTVSTTWTNNDGREVSLVLHEYEAPNHDFQFKTARTSNSGTNAVQFIESGFINPSDIPDALIISALYSREEIDEVIWANNFTNNHRFNATFNAFGQTIQSAFKVLSHSNFAVTSASFNQNAHVTTALVSFNLINSPLPVELTSFTANCVDNEFIQVKWNTSSEINNSHFVLEYSTTGEFFEPVAFVEGAGTSAQANSYEYFFRTTNGGGKHFFRLTQIDFDGTQEVFNPIVTSCSSSRSAVSLGFFPNPSRGMITLTGNVSSVEQLEIYDLFGRIVKTVRSNEASRQVDVSNLIQGTYLVVAITSTQRFPVGKLILTH